eukprot:s784_g15.t1
MARRRPAVPCRAAATGTQRAAAAAAFSALVAASSRESAFAVAKGPRRAFLAAAAAAAAPGAASAEDFAGWEGKLRAVATAGLALAKAAEAKGVRGSGHCAAIEEDSSQASEGKLTGKQPDPLSADQPVAGKSSVLLPIQSSSSSSGARKSWSLASSAAVIDVETEVSAFRASVAESSPGTSSRQRGRKRSAASCLAEDKETATSGGASSSSVPALEPYQPPRPLQRQVAAEEPEPSPGEHFSSPASHHKERWFLALGSKIVGVQHYDGVVSDRENVVLRRQPTNPYDRNAIQVLNMRSEQIGHVPREMAAALAPVMDRLSAAQGGEGQELRVEGSIPRGSGNVFSIPMRLQVFAQDPSGRLAPQLRDLGERLRRTYCAAARGSVEVVSSPQEDGTPEPCLKKDYFVVADMTPEMWRSIAGGKALKAPKPTGPSMGDIIERELEGIFRDPRGYEAAPEASQPRELITGLYPHQLSLGEPRAFRFNDYKASRFKSQVPSAGPSRTAPRKALHWMLQQERILTVEEKLAEASCQERHISIPIVVASENEGTSAASSATRGRTKAARSAAAPLQQVFFWTKDGSLCVGIPETAQWIRTLHVSVLGCRTCGHKTEVSPSGMIVYKNLATNSAFKKPPRLPRGGILADDMGLGKTITTIALILASPQRESRATAGKLPGRGRHCRSDLGVSEN